MSSAGKWAKKALGYMFDEPGLLERALTHKSKSAANNERLEFLGDAVLGMVIAECLHQGQPDADEHILTRMRARLVRGETLGDIATELGLANWLLLGSGEHRRHSILADTLEAIFGAVYLDGGYDSARQVILALYEDRLNNLPRPDELKDPKTVLQEYLQAQGLSLPAYEVVKEQGPEHAPVFDVRCNVDGLQIETFGSGTSRRKAEQIAAEKALQLLEQKE